MILLLLAGIYLASDGPSGLGDFFISWGFVAIIVLFGLPTPSSSRGRSRRSSSPSATWPRPSGKLSAEFEALSGRLAGVGISPA